MGISIFLLLILFLCFINLITVSFLFIMDCTETLSYQKVNLIKISLIISVISPIFYFISIFIPSNSINLTSINTLIDNSIYLSNPIIVSIKNTNWTNIIFSMYCVGVFLGFFQILLSYLLVLKKLSAKRKLRIDNQCIYLVNDINRPFSFGFLFPKIFFPENYHDQWAEQQIKVSLVHERIHLKHCDPFWNLFSLCVKSVLFFSPLAFYMHRRFILEMEILCDKKTLIETGLNINEYGDILLGMASTRTNNLICTNLTDSNLKRRFLSMKLNQVKRPLLASVSYCILLMISTVVIAATSEVGSVIYETSSKVFIDGNLMSSPQIITHANQLGRITVANKDKTEGITLEVNPKISNLYGTKNTINMYYHISYRNGLNKIDSKSHISVLPNQESLVKISEAGHILELHLLVKKV